MAHLNRSIHGPDVAINVRWQMRLSRQERRVWQYQSKPHPNHRYHFVGHEKPDPPDRERCRRKTVFGLLALPKLGIPRPFMNVVFGTHSSDRKAC